MDKKEDEVLGSALDGSKEQEHAKENEDSHNSEEEAV